jgi:magnesium-transporting ATPase (P-type)
MANMNQTLAAQPTPQTVPYYALDADQALAQLQTALRGLTADERARRLARYGPNAIVKERGTPLWRAFVANLTNFFAILLWCAAALSFLTGGNESGIAIIAVILINAVFSFAQEYRAEQAIAALQRLLPAEAKVRCAGEVVPVPAATLVPGDILILEAGDNISADARLLHEFDLRANQATLTGESEPVRKTADLVSGERLTWTQLPNLVFAGTNVASGTGDAVVFATGMQSAFGRIAF